MAIFSKLNQTKSKYMQKDTSEVLKMRGDYGLRSVIVMQSNQMDITLKLLFALKVHFHFFQI